VDWHETRLRNNWIYEVFTRNRRAQPQKNIDSPKRKEKCDGRKLGKNGIEVHLQGLAERGVPKTRWGFNLPQCLKQIKRHAQAKEIRPDWDGNHP